MAELRRNTSLGELRVHGWERPTMEAALEEGLELVRGARTVGEFTHFAGHEVYLKGGPLRLRTRLRHGLGAWVVRRRWPRVREYENLSWLIERHFQAALPLAAGVLLRRGLPHYQFLATARIPDATTLDTFVEDSSGSERAIILEELAREVARMHALGFVHHDLFPRNLLILPVGCPRRVVFLDAWAGGPPPGWRGPSYDLGSLFLEAGELFEAAEQRRFLDVYRAARAAQDRPVEEDWLDRAARARGRLRARLVQQPHRLRGKPLPRAQWPDFET